MAKDLKQNFELNGEWYGPDYPDAKLPDGAEVGDHVYEDPDTSFPAGAARPVEAQDASDAPEPAKGRSAAKG
jgi:hypothetical protein